MALPGLEKLIIALWRRLSILERQNIIKALLGEQEEMKHGK